MSYNYIKLKINPTHFDIMKDELMDLRHQWDNTCVYIEKDIDYMKLASVRMYLEQLGIVGYITNISHIVIKAGEKLPVHVDELHRFQWSLTLPFRNIEGTYNRFYKSDKPLERMVDTNDYGPWAVGSCLGYSDMEGVYLIDEVEVDGPILIDTRKPHDVVNRTTHDREAIGVRLNTKFDPEMLLPYYLDDLPLL